MIVLTLFWIFFGLLCCFLAQQFTYACVCVIVWLRKKVPFVVPKFPFIFGNISREKHRALHFVDFYKNHRTDHPIIGFFMFSNPSVLIVDLELIQIILKSDFQYFQDRGMYNNEKCDPLSSILGSLNYDKWKSLRQKLTPAFTKLKMEKMFETIKEFGEELVKGFNETIVIDNDIEIRDLFSRFTTDVIGRKVIGICDDSDDCGIKLREMVKRAMSPYLKFPLNYLTLAYPDFSRFLGIRKHDKLISNFIMACVEKTIQDRQWNNAIVHKDFMQLLINAGLTAKEIAPLAFDLLSAGYADSTSTLAFCLYELSLAENQHIQDRARTEIQFVLKQHNGQLTYDALNKMIYCKQIINGKFCKCQYFMN